MPQKEQNPLIRLAIIGLIVIGIIVGGKMGVDVIGAVKEAAIIAEKLDGAAVTHIDDVPDVTAHDPAPAP